MSAVTAFTSVQSAQGTPVHPLVTALFDVLGETGELGCLADPDMALFASVIRERASDPGLAENLCLAFACLEAVGARVAAQQVLQLASWCVGIAGD